jgi:hypothetical protein
LHTDTPQVLPAALDALRGAIRIDADAGAVDPLVLGVLR